VSQLIGESSIQKQTAAITRKLTKHAYIKYRSHRLMMLCTVDVHRHTCNNLTTAVMMPVYTVFQKMASFFF